MNTVGIHYHELKNKTCICQKHLEEIPSNVNGLACLEAIFKSYRVPYTKKEVLARQIAQAALIVETKATNEDKCQRIIDLFRTESPLLKTLNLIVKLGNKKFVDFSGDLLKLTFDYFKVKEKNKEPLTGKTEVYKGLYMDENMVDYLDKYFKKDEYMFFADVV